MVREFLRHEFGLICWGVTFEAMARRLTPVMHDAEFSPIDPDEWDSTEEDLR